MGPFFPNRQRGTSLLELIMAASIMAVIAYFAGQFFQRMGKSEYSARAKSSAIGETALFMNAIERDFKLRDISASSTSAAVCGSKCNKFDITRKVRVGDGDGDMKVSYESSCETVPANMKNTKFKDEITGAAFDFTKAPNAQCMSMSPCKAGSYPQFKITLSPPGGAVLPVYPRLQGKVAKFPDLTEKVSAASSVIGAAACAESKMGSGATGSDRIIMEVAYITSEGRYAVEKREITIPRSNVAKIQMLPSK